MGPARFGVAVGKIIQESNLQFFPSCGEFRGYIPSDVRIVHCGNCVDGFVYVPDYEARRLYHNETAMQVRKCGCARVA